MSTQDSVEDLHSTNKMILSAMRELDSSMAEAVGAIEQLDVTLGAILEATQGGGGGGAATGAAAGGRGRGGAGRPAAPSKAGKRGGGGGLFGAIGAIQAHPAMAAASIVAGVVGPSVGAGAVSAARGGDFASGFESSMNQRLGKIPFLGEASGLAGGARIEAKTTQRVAQATGQIRALGGQVTPDVEDFLIREVAGQESRREDQEERIRMRSQQIFKNDPGLRGDRPRVDSFDVGASMSPFYWAIQRGSEALGLGQHK